MKEAYEYIQLVNHRSSEVNPDTMTYEELLELQEKIGHVNRGLSDQQIEKLRTERVLITNSASLPEK